MNGGLKAPYVYVRPHLNLGLFGLRPLPLVGLLPPFILYIKRYDEQKRSPKFSAHFFLTVHSVPRRADTAQL